LLKQRVAPYGLSTGRRIEALISRFVDAGYLTLSVPATDRRLRIITPTEKMIDHDLEWLAVHYRPLHILFPETGYYPPMQRDPAFQRNLRRISGKFTAYAAELMANNPDVMFFMQRDAGTMILLKLISLGNADGAARVSLSDLADRFGISRTHVRKTILEAENRSLLRYSATMITLAPGLVAAYDRFVADTMSGHDAMFKMAMS
jgi:DNA-binding MarR family transcriptional regulator